MSVEVSKEEGDDRETGAAREIQGFWRRREEEALLERARETLKDLPKDATLRESACLRVLADLANIRALFLKAQALYFLGRFEEAIRAADEALRGNEDPRALLLRARAYCALRQFQSATLDLTQLIDQSRGHKNPSSEEEKNARRKREDTKNAAHFLRGSLRSFTGDWQGAEHDFDAHLRGLADNERTSTKARALESLAIAVAANDDYKRALHLITDALVLDPNPAAMCLLARLHCCERQWHLAEERYRDALQLDPHFQGAIVGLHQATIAHEPMPLLG